MTTPTLTQDEKYALRDKIHADLMKMYEVIKGIEEANLFAHYLIRFGAVLIYTNREGLSKNCASIQEALKDARNQIDMYDQNKHN